MQLKWIEMPFITTVVYTVYFNHRHKRVILFYASDVSKIPIIYYCACAHVLACKKRLKIKLEKLN